MARDWKNSICNQPTTVNLTDINRYVDTASITLSPIDQFYKQRTEVLRLCTPQWAASFPSIAPLMIVALVSAVENYYRELLSSLVKICPITQKKAKGKTIQLASIYFGYENVEKSLFENNSFTDQKVLSNSLKNFCGIDVNSADSQIKQPLAEFNKLCELRHSVVHSSNIISSKNAVELELQGRREFYQVNVTYAEVQEAAEICTSLVCASNIDVFDKYVDRWAFAWRQLPTYNSSDDWKKFKELIKIFYSSIDSNNRTIPNPLSFLKIKNLIQRELNI